MFSPYVITQINDVRDTVVRMSSMASNQLHFASKACIERDAEAADEAETLDEGIDRIEMEVDDKVITFIARHAPVASDCRRMIAASKIASNLERIGDQSTSIARRARKLNRQPESGCAIDLPLIAEEAASMLRDGIRAFAEEDPDLAEAVIGRDATVDELNHDLTRELTHFMQGNPAAISRCLDLMIVVKCYERIADHCQNIAEEVYYLARGTDIRHRGLTAVSRK